MKRIVFAALAAASVSALAVGCGSDDSSDTSSASATSAAQSTSDSLAEPATTGDVYLDTCNGVLAYIETMKESGLAADDAAVQAIGDEFLTLAQAEPDWAGKSEQDKADFERGMNAAVAGSC
ncbi:hypothetical protein ACFYVR_06305 [Rhodococcus sp. NPDC003318]|uniref:hypothetical protein n=1 Tax=Rhodococcus sp. NPDC003318 TaxID=3364503 RepID=UPI00367DC960